MTFEFEYLGEFESMFENNLKKESGDQERAFEEKKREPKISCKCTFNHAASSHILTEEANSEESGLPELRPIPANCGSPV
jgi:hypothetical protein